MYDNSRVTSYTNMSSRPCRIQYSRWSLNTPTSGMAIGQIEPQSTATLSSSFYFPKKQQEKQNLVPNYVNIDPSLSKSSSRLSNYQRPKSTIIQDFTLPKQSTFHNNNLSQRYESKTVVGIVKPMIHQRSYNQLNTNNNNNINYNETKMPELLIPSSYHNSTRSLYPQPPPTLTPSSSSSSSSSIIYRSRRNISYNNNNNNSNGQPPPAPRRHSSISNSKCSSSHRSSRTTSTTSSIGIVNELSPTISIQENERQQKNNNNRIVVDVKRLEMFYGSVGTLVKSARSIARLYTATTRQLANFEDWSSQQCGVPVWIYNTGANLKRTRQVRLVLAQHESCFAVWSSLISDQAELRIPKENYITCWLPETNVLIVFKFEYEDACRSFFRHYYEMLEHERRQNLVNTPPLPNEDISQSTQQTLRISNKEIPRRYSRLRTLGNKQDKDHQQQFDLRRCRSLSKIRTVKKSDISRPINFEHVNHLSSGCNQDRPLLGTATLRSLHASMSHLPHNGTLADRCSKQSRSHISTLFQPQTTAV